jgi:hypothetical protein
MEVKTPEVKYLRKSSQKPKEVIPPAFFYTVQTPEVPSRLESLNGNSLP